MICSSPLSDLKRFRVGSAHLSNKRSRPNFHARKGEVPQGSALAGGPELTLLAWSLGGAIALMGALTFAGLGRLYPRTAGQYEILRDAYGPMPAFVYVFCNATAVQAGSVAIMALLCS